MYIFICVYIYLFRLFASFDACGTAVSAVALRFPPPRMSVDKNKRKATTMNAMMLDAMMKAMIRAAAAGEGGGDLQSVRDLHV